MDLNSQINHDAVLIETSLFLDNRDLEKETNDATTKNDETTVHVKANFRKDLGTIIFLMFLYFLQGIPLGSQIFISSNNININLENCFQKI
jgi:hypothetical protein